MFRFLFRMAALCLVLLHCQLAVVPCSIGDSCNPLSISLLFQSPARAPRLTGIVLGASASIDLHLPDGSFQAALFPGEAPEIVSADQQTREIYWSNAVSQYLRRGAFSGGGVTTVITGFSVGGGVLDNTTNLLYFTDNTAGTVYRAQRDGSSPVLLGTPGDSPQAPFLWGSYLYFPRKDASLLARLHTATLQFEEVTVAAPGNMFIAIPDPLGRQIFYSIAANGIFVSGTEPGAVPAYLTGSGTPFGIAVDPYAGHLFYRDGAILYRCSIRGDQCVSLSSGLTGSGIALQFDRP